MAAVNRILKAWRPFLAGALVLAGLAAAATPAAAASTNRIGLCNKANYTSFLDFPLRDGFYTFEVAPGKCWSGTITAGSRESVRVFALRPNEFKYIGSAGINTNVKNVIRTYGTINAPYFTISRD
ncbi:hypothetical protein [Micromonospora sp. NPDC003241]